MIEYNWPPQWKDAPVLDPVQKEQLISGKVLILPLHRFRQYDLFRIDGKIAVCIYADWNCCWIRTMMPEETSYIDKKEEKE